MHSESDDRNPYASPVAEETPAEREHPTDRSVGWGWLVGYGVNLPVPIMFAMMFISPAGFTGMLVGIIMVMSIGMLAARRLKQLNRIALRGGLLLAITQLFPILQMFSGIMAGSTLEKLGYPFDSMVDSPAGTNLGFVPCMLAVLMVSAMLMTMALGIGTVIELFFPKRDRAKKSV